LFEILSLSPSLLMMLLLLQLSSQLCLRSQKLGVLGFGVCLFVWRSFLFLLFSSATNSV
jgi:hypothetical protein